MNSPSANPFEHIVGQKELKSKLGFYLEAYEATHILPFFLFGGPKGSGKTLVARTLSKLLTNEDGVKRPVLEINSATIRNARQFVEQIFVPLVANNSITLFFDEAHKLPSDLTMMLLTVLNTEKDHLREVTYGDETLHFNFKKVSIIFATTETDLIFAPLKDRMTLLDFAPYSNEEIGQIIQLHAPEVVFEDVDAVAAVSRGNGRTCVQLAKDIDRWCKVKGDNFFYLSDWAAFKHRLGIKPFGLNNMEIAVMRALKERGKLSLQMLAAITGMSPTALRRDVENFLLRMGFLAIEGQRRLTQRGVEAMEAL